MILEPGLVIGQNVRLLGELGRGGMGSVWAAEHLTLHIEVAVKFMATEMAQNRDAIARFTSEATAAARIKSPHVVQIFDHGVTDDALPYIVMEKLEGEALAARLERSGSLSASDVLTIVHQLGRALARAHGSGIVHRDIKPENIFLVDSAGELFIKVLDFGIAKRPASEAVPYTTWSGMTVGTPHYMSPEQALSPQNVDFTTDLWAVAVVAYEALTGRLPFMAETVGAICVAIDKGVFVPPSALRPELGPAIDAWFSRAFSREPAARFPSATEMADAFEEAVFGANRCAAAAISADGDSGQRERMLWLVSGGVVAGILGAVIAAIVATKTARSVTTGAAAVVSVATAHAHNLPSDGPASHAGERATSEVVVQPELTIGATSEPPSERSNASPHARPTRRATVPASVRHSVDWQPAVPRPRVLSRPDATTRRFKDRGF